MWLAFERPRLILRLDRIVQPFLQNKTLTQTVAVHVAHTLGTEVDSVLA